MTLQGRPLYDNRADAQLFVHRPEWNRLHRALQHGLNIVILGFRGVGKTSLLRQIQYVLRGDRHPVAYVDATAIQDPVELAARINAAVVGTAVGAGVTNQAEPQPAAASQQFYALIQSLGDAPETTILVDASDAGDAIYAVFGRMRDVIWQLPHQWVVAIDKGEVGKVLKPPADAFFDLALDLKPWETSDLVALLEERAPDFDATTRLRIAAGADGNPRIALRALRDALVEERDPDEALSRRADLMAAAADLGRPHAAVLDALFDRGPSSPSDPGLQAVLGLSRGRVAAIMSDLAERGLVAARPDASDSPGRPRSVYSPNLEPK
jgi:hypothetical protein